MYKTVRHGENSLQYTILPQTEEVLSNSGLKGKGRDYSPSIHVRRSRKRSTVKYVLLVTFGLMIAVMLAAIPICVMNGALYTRRSQMNRHGITSAPLTPTGREIVKSRKKELKLSPDIASTLKSKLEASTTTTLPMTSTTVLSSTAANERATTPPWTMPALRSWKSSTSSTTLRPLPTEGHEEVPFKGTSSGSIPLLDHYMSVRPWEKDIIIRPTVTPELVTIRNVFRYYSRSSIPPEKIVTSKVFEDVLIASKPTTTTSSTTEVSNETKFKDLKDTILSVDDDDEFKESLEVDEVFSLPPLKPEPKTDDVEVTVSKAGDGGWYGARWPFVDTSSYFQWTGYSPGDNLLLPLLVAALSSVALVLLLALAVRRRKRSHTTSAHIGLTSDLQADDNTNLLAESQEPEEAEE